MRRLGSRIDDLGSLELAPAEVDVGGRDRRLLGTDVEVHVLRSSGCRGTCNDRRTRGRFTRRIAGIPGIDVIAKGNCLIPDFACTPGGLLQIARHLLERLGVLAIGVNLQQLEMDFVAFRRAFQRFLEQLLGLRIAPVGKENLRLGYRVDLPGRFCWRFGDRPDVAIDADCCGRGCFGEGPRRARFFGVGLRFTPALDGAHREGADNDQHTDGRTEIGRLIHDLIQQAGRRDWFGGGRLRLRRCRL